MASGKHRKLVLLRHAKSAWPGVPDHERPLARRGRSDAPVMGRWLRTEGCVPDHVLCSTARRARQTWQLAAAGLGSSPAVSFDDRIYQASAADLLNLIRQASSESRVLLVIGHDPAIPELALLLARAATGNHSASPGSPAGQPGAVDRISIKFPTAAVAVLDFAGAWPGLSPGRARLACFVTPRDISAVTS